MTWGAIRRGLQTIHLWMGLILALPLIAIGLSGSILLAQRELLALDVPAAVAAGEKQPLIRIIAAAEATDPGRLVTRIQVPADGRDAAVVRLQTTERPLVANDVYVDPVSLEILDTRPVLPRGPVARWFINLHAFLMLPPQKGLTVDGWVAVAMTVMALSGLVLWWPKKGFWRRAIWVRKGARGLSLHLDLHHAIGFWGLAVFLVMSVSGIYLTFPESFHATVATLLPTGVNADAPLPANTPPPGPFDADKAVAAAAAVVPEARVLVLQLPDRPGRPIVVEMENTGFGPGTPPILVTLDPGNGELGYIDDPRRYAIGDKVLNLQHTMHFGIGMGRVWQAIVFLSGLLPLFLAITGTSIWWLRRQARRPVSAGVTAADVPAE